MNARRKMRVLVNIWILLLTLAIVAALLYKQSIFLMIIAFVSGLFFAAIPFKSGLEFLLYKKTHEDTFETELTAAVLAGMSLVILILTKRFM